MHKPVMIVGEAYGEQEERDGKPFSGPSGQVLRGLMRQAGIAESECYITNVFNLRPRGNRIEGFYGPKNLALPGWPAIERGKYISAEYAPELERLLAEVERTRPNVIIALGNTPLWALTHKTGIKRYRGAPISSFNGRWKVIPTWPPASILRQWELRVIALADFYKARRESASPELNRPQRFIYMEPSLDDIKAFYEQYLKNEPFVSCDVETKMKTITEVGYGTADGKHCLVIPFWSRSKSDGNYWPTLREEREAWAWCRLINTTKPLIGQNFSYDMQYFWRTVKIPCPQFLGDTMLLHHSLQPELEKGLGFLGSVYTDEPSWKFMRTDHSTLKKGDD